MLVIIIQPKIAILVIQKIKQKEKKIVILIIIKGILKIIKIMKMMIAIKIF